jgi:hypothetical protein
MKAHEDQGLRIESFAVIHLRGVSTNKKYYMFYRQANKPTKNLKKQFVLTQKVC